MKIKIISAVFIFCFFSAFLNAEDIRMSASVNKTSVPLNEAFQLTISISGDSKTLPDFSAPTLQDFNTYASSQSKNFSIINGNITNTVSYIYTLGPKKTGEYEIPAFKLSYKGQTYGTDPIKITVEKAREVSSVSVQDAQNPQYRSPSSEIYDFDTSKAVFVKASVDKKNIYVNEKIVYTFSFYTSVNLLSNHSYQAPNFTGFFSGKTVQNTYRTKINSRDYIVNEVSTELFPQSRGNLKIGSSVIQISIEDFSKSHDDFFSSFFTRSKNVALSTEEININVLEAPENISMVGNFQMTASADKKQKKENEPFDLKITVTGDGNVKTIKEPQISLSDNLKKYETSEKILSDDKSDTGKEFTILIMPVNSGRAEIKILPLKYFDSKTKQIKILPSKTLSMNVLKDASENKDESKNLSDNAVFEKNNGVSNSQLQNIDLSFVLKAYNFLQKPGFWKILGLLFILLVCLKIFFKYRDYANKDKQKLKNKKAYRKAKKYFQKAKKTKVSAEFYDFMYKGMLAYFASVLAKSADGLTAYKIRKELEERNVDGELINSIEQILEQCAAVLYSQISSGDTKNLKEFYDSTFDILKKLDI